jgi:hypothetical protein
MEAKVFYVISRVFDETETKIAHIFEYEHEAAYKYSGLPKSDYLLERCVFNYRGDIISIDVADELEDDEENDFYVPFWRNVEVNGD